MNTLFEGRCLCIRKLVVSLVGGNHSHQSKPVHNFTGLDSTMPHLNTNNFLRIERWLYLLRVPNKLAQLYFKGLPSH